MIFQVLAGAVERLRIMMDDDPVAGRLFVTDGSKAKNRRVFDECSGKVIKCLNPGDSPGIKFNGKRNETYISQCESKKVLPLDGTICEVKNSGSSDRHPDSLLVSPDGQTLFVTLKPGFNDDHRSQGLDGVARITLQ